MPDPTLQERIVATRMARGYTVDPLRLFMLLGEELGEIARELKRTWTTGEGTLDKARLGDEIADATVLLYALAAHFDVDLEQAIGEKFFRKDEERARKRREKRP